MKIRKCTISKLLLASGLLVSLAHAEEPESIMNCLQKTDSLACANVYFRTEIDRIEFEVSGRKSDVPMSRVIEEAGIFVVEGLDVIFGTGSDEVALAEKDIWTNNGQGEGRGKKKLKSKKKKLLAKLLTIGMLLKSKISFLLQLFHAHFQIKFFVVAVLGLLVNAARFWLEYKKHHQPSKVIYYENAQHAHQHHYEHEEDHDQGGYFKRSFDEDPQKLAYSAHVPEN